MWLWISRCLFVLFAAAFSESLRSFSMPLLEESPFELYSHCAQVIMHFLRPRRDICSRQFNHRCKGISMASFKPEEIKALEAGGNGVSVGTAHSGLFDTRMYTL